jgi:hypothetical protein
MKMRWICPACNRKNEDARRSFVICIGCGKTYDEMPTKKGSKK